MSEIGLIPDSRVNRLTPGAQPSPKFTHFDTQSSQKSTNASLSRTHSFETEHENSVGRSIYHLKAIFSKAERDFIDFRSTALLQIEKAGRSARDEGFRAGLSTVRHALDRLSQIHAQMRVKIEAFVGESVLEIAQEVIGEAIHSQPGALAARVKRVIESFDSFSMIRIQTHPEDHQHLLPSLSEFVHESIESQRQFQLSVNGNLSRGSVLIESEQGEIHLNPETHFSSIADAVHAQGLFRSAVAGMFDTTSLDCIPGDRTHGVAQEEKES